MLDKINTKDIVAIAKEAGDAIMQIYSQDFEVEYKKDNSPLTLDDKKANDIIENRLNQLSVNLPILSEEGVNIPFHERKKWEYFWLVGPSDGTKEFIKKNGEFTVNIALINKDISVLGVVYAPALDTCYWAKKGDGAFKNGKSLPITEEREVYRIVVSRSHMSDETRLFVADIATSKKKELVSIGSSLKICLVAEGKADIYPRLGPTMEWDTGAAHAIVNESNASLVKYTPDGDSQQHKYNKSNLLNSSFVVTGAQ